MSDTNKETTGLSHPIKGTGSFSFEVVGGKKLKGEITPQGAKKRSIAGD